VSAATGGLAYGGLTVSLTVVAEKFTNTLAQPTVGRLSDRRGRASFVALGGTYYGLVAFAVPLSPLVGRELGLQAALPVPGPLSPAFLALVALSGLLGVADSLSNRRAGRCSPTRGPTRAASRRVSASATCSGDRGTSWLRSSAGG
jgi:MFS family permease